MTMKSTPQNSKGSNTSFPIHIALKSLRGCSRKRVYSKITQIEVLTKDE